MGGTSKYRDRLGDLLLLRKTFNASYGAETYANKRKHYVEHDILAKSLHPQAYEHNPGFTRFVRDSGLPFHSVDEFKKADLDERQSLYRQIAEGIWMPDWLDRIADGETGRAVMALRPATRLLGLTPWRQREALGGAVSHCTARTSGLPWAMLIDEQRRRNACVFAGENAASADNQR